MRKTLISLLTLVFVLSLLTNAYAYATYLGGEWTSANPLNWFYDNYISTKSKAGFSNGATAWNNVNYSKVKFTFNTGPVYAFETSNSSVEWAGQATLSPSPAGPTYTSASVKYNTYYTSKTEYDTGAMQYIAAHEFGHVLGLDENNSDICVMRQGVLGPEGTYSKYHITTPQSVDISGMKNIYFDN